MKTPIFTPRCKRLIERAAYAFARSCHTFVTNRRFLHWLREERRFKAKAQAEFFKANP